MKELTNFDKAYFEILDRIECGYDKGHAIEEVADQMNITDDEYQKLYDVFI